MANWCNETAWNKGRLIAEEWRNKKLMKILNDDNQIEGVGVNMIEWW